MKLGGGLALSGAMVLAIFVGEIVAPEPHHVLLVGDSIMRQTGPALDAELADRYAVDNRGVNNAGFLTPDFYDWEQEIVGLQAKYQPDTVVLLAIGNYVAHPDDRWVTDDGEAVRHASPRFATEWKKATNRMVAGILDRNPDAEIIIVLPPPMPTDRTQAIVDRLRDAYREVDRRWPEVRLVDAYDALAEEGAYAVELESRDGGLEAVRTADTIHLTEAGQRRLAAVIAPAIGGSS